MAKKNRNRKSPRFAVTSTRPEFGGKWIKELRDGIMASFPAVSKCCLCRNKIQEACFKSKAFQLRIGVHQGEVVFENDDIFGDAVNIASRLQVLAPPAGFRAGVYVLYRKIEEAVLYLYLILKKSLQNIFLS